MTSKKLFVAAAVASTVLVSGCSDYPDSGYLDTQQVSERFAIVDISGDVYGAKAGTFDLIENLRHDADMLLSQYGDNEVSYPDEVFKAIQAGEAMPTMSLEFPSGEGFPDMTGIEEAIQAEVRAYIDRVESEVAEQITAQQKEMAELEAEVTEAENKLGNYSANVKKAEAALEAARTELNNAIDSYNSVQDKSLEVLNAALTKAGVDSKFSSNPLTRYRYIDFANKTKPGTCPRQRRNIAVNLLSEWEKCIYIYDPSGNRFGSAEPTISALAKEYLLKIDAAGAKIGQKGGWNKKATGLYAAVDDAEETLQDARRGGDTGVRNPRMMQLSLERNQQRLAEYKERIAQLEAPEYLQNELWENDHMPDYRRNVSEAHGERVRSYIEAMRQHLNDQVVKVSPLEFDSETEDARFTDFDGDFDAISIASNIVMSAGGRRTAQSLISSRHLLDPSLADAEELVVDVDSKDAERFDMDNLEEVQHEIMARLLRMNVEVAEG